MPCAFLHFRRIPSGGRPEHEEAGVAVGWFVGYVEKGGNVYFIALNMTSPRSKRDGGKIFAERKSSAIEILKDLGVL